MVSFDVQVGAMDVSMIPMLSTNTDNLGAPLTSLMFLGKSLTFVRAGALFTLIHVSHHIIRQRLHVVSHLLLQESRRLRMREMRIKSVDDHFDPIASSMALSR